jgi:ribosome-binding protein aMBF1 (putative translation factor)
MIRNERQYRITRAQADKFTEAIAAAERAGPAPKVHPRLHKASLDAMRSQLEDLERDLKTYDDLKRGRGRKSLAGTFAELGALLIQARIARGWTQRELAERLGLQMQKIQQYEATEYEAASLARLLQVWEALGAEVDVKAKLVDLPDLAEFAAADISVGSTARRTR